jgi:pyruvate dehydrogenase E1 component alpha subunit/2-oxoisovalerate dehydrogenase E1 component alpha subunit
MTTSLSADQQIELYRFMLLNRLVEERLVNLYRQGQVVGGLYRSLGQEATSCATAFALGEGDILAPLIRNLGSTIVRGVSPRDILTQYMARSTSPSHGKDANLHFSVPEKGLYAPISMLGTLIPVVTGMLLAERLKGTRTVGMTYIGDGGTSVGAFHEGLNFAAVQKLPLVLVVEFNRWAYSTPYEKQCAAATLADKAVGYGIPGVVVDGNDALAL